MRRREVITLLGGVAAAWPLGGRAQQPAMPVIGYLNQGSPESDAFRLAGLRQGLNQSGYIPGLNALQFAAPDKAAQALMIQSETIEIRPPDDIERALETATTRGVEAGIVLQSVLAFNTSKQFAELALAKRLPLISLFAEFPKAGGLIGYGPNLIELFRRCGDYVAKILHGAKPSDLPIQRPEKFDLVINLKTAAALGLNIPTQLQQLADEVIE